MTNIGSCICAFDWHQDRWPWMTEHRTVQILSEFRGISQIWDATAVKQLKIDPYCQMSATAL